MVAYQIFVKMNRFYLSTLLLCLYLVNVENVKILGVFPSTGYSQFILAEKLMSELARRGHQVTVISVFQPKVEIENYRTISVKETADLFSDNNSFDLEDISIFMSIDMIYQFGYMISEAVLKHDNVLKLLNSNETFDLVIVEQFVDEALSAFAHHYQTPLILFCSIGVSEWNYMMGNPAIPSISPLSTTPYSRDMAFFERIWNLFITIHNEFHRNFVILPKHQQLADKYFPKSVNLNDLLRNTSLMLLNSHITTSENAPLVHGMVEIGGFHISENHLSEELQKYLDQADNGAIYFSLGTNVNSSHLTEERINAIITVFSKLPQRVLWKCDQRQFTNLTKNVFISNWFNQSDILAHPNVQLFITHGGLLSTTEAIFYGKPLLGIPIFGDQKMNMNRAKRRGIAKVLPLKQLNEENLLNSINEVINNSIYSDNARFMSNIMRDTVVRPLDLAMYWIEYVIRQKGFRLKPPTSDLYWYQLYMLDIVAFLLFILISIIVILKVLTRIATKKKNNKKKHKRQ